MFRTRIVAALTTAVLVSLSACAGGGQVAKAKSGDYTDKLKIKVSFNPTVPESDLLALALKKTDIGATWGLDLNMIPFSTSAETVSAASSGSVDLFWSGDGPLGGAMSRGIKFRVIGEDSGWIQGIAVDENSPIRTIADLKGKRVGTHEGNTLTLYVQDMVRKAGLKLSDLKWLNVPITEQQAVWAAHKLDAVVSWSPTLYQFPGTRLIYEEAAGAGKPYPANVIAVRESLAKDNREALVRVLGAILTANWWVKEHLDTVSQWYIQETRTDPALLKKMLAGSSLFQAKSIEQLDVSVSPEHVKRMTRTAQLFGESQKVESTVDYADVTDNSFAKEARERLIKRQGELSDIKITK